MFDEFLSVREGEEHRQQLLKEAEDYQLRKELGYNDYKITRWVALLVIVLLAVALVIY